MFIYNSLTEKKENLDEILGGSKKIRLFVCGPTVYDYSHIGHARTYIFFDMVKRWLEHFGYKTSYLQNITDIDDKIIERAKSEAVKPRVLAKKFEKEYYADMKALGVANVKKYARASDHLKQIIVQIKTLIEKGFAYQTSSGVYFEVKKFKEYGKLSKQNLNALRAGWRIEIDPEKKDPMDFALWKTQRHGYEPSWSSPWGEGRPGWHIEDTAITEKYFGSSYDIHGGGMDLKFPHHESEIAQQEAASGVKPLAKIWMHTGFLSVNGEKMSKSLGNFITIRDFLKNHRPTALRYLAISHHYRSPINYTEELVNQTESALNGLAQFAFKLSMAAAKNPAGMEIKKYNASFTAAIQDDFNTPEALATIFSFNNAANLKIWKLTKKEGREALIWLKKSLNLLGIALEIPTIPLKILWRAKKRELSRINKQFAKSDVLRKEIEALGYTVEDTPNGPFIWPKRI